ncbi:unnamed protein product [Caenorhabditis auriculariae]|uniref:Uncharacterized protein n=1 Tax=Caenorhabditis auriculariae TaxID=2777116 RepID=A0A8S1GP12_9PELO|nr:unnamed protein product [Caenorhabditis auriculariae]
MMPDEKNGRVFVVESTRRDDAVRTILLIILLIVFPPAAVAVHANECNVHVFISLLLILLFIVPAYIHGIWYCFIRKPRAVILA